MKTSLHLISMPWGCPSSPCIQTSVLKSFVDRTLSGRVEVKTHSPFVVIPFTTGMPGTFTKLSEYEEYPYLLLCLRRYWKKAGDLRAADFDTFVAKLNASGRARHGLTKSALRKLDTATRDYVDNTLIPQLSEDGVNLVGFSLNYAQVYASLYCSLYLRERRPDLACLFVFGGMSASYPHVAEALRISGIKGLGVVGEGEKKLVALVEFCLNAPEDGVEALIAGASRAVPGSYDIQNNAVNLYERNKDFYKSQIAFLGDIPLPDFREYFALINGSGQESPPPRYSAVREVVYLPYEGTRGCFAKCDFCNLNATWEGFRKNAPENILNNAFRLAETYGIYRIQFLDNVCDTWAEAYAESLIENGSMLPSFMELRAHHPEMFWTKLALCGVAAVQVGIEMLSPELLKKIGKGTTVLQNLRVQKWLRELGIRSTSNLITHHPKSTLSDVEETRRILELTPHLDRYTISPFSLAFGSPLYFELDSEARKTLRGKHWIRFPKSLDRHVIPNLGFEVPEEWVDRDVNRAWDGLIRWYKTHRDALVEGTALTALRCRNGGILITDSRCGKEVRVELRGEEAAVYDICHAGALPDAVARKSGIAPERTARILDDLARRSLLVAVEGSYLSLALRPRDELIRNYYEVMNKAAATPVTMAEEANLRTYPVSERRSTASLTAIAAGAATFQPRDG